LNVLEQGQELALQELEGQKDVWEKPQDLCKDAIQKLFVVLSNMDIDEPIFFDKKGNLKLSQGQITDYLKNAMEKLTNDAIEQNIQDEEYEIESLIAFAIMSNCKKSGKDFVLNPNLREELEVGTKEQEESVDFIKYKNDADFVSDELKNNYFAQSEEEVLTQLAHLVPYDCEEYYPRPVVPGNNAEMAVTDLSVLESAYEENLHVCLIGDCGSGKTLSLKKLAYELEVPYKSLSFNGACTIEDLLGTFIRDRMWDEEEHKWVTDWMWIDGWLAKLARYGGIFVAEEINAAPPEILFVLHDLLGHISHKLDLTQAGGDIIDAHKDFFFACTMNPDYDGTNSLNAALMDRFDIVLDYPYDTDLEKNFVRDPNLLALIEALRDMYPHEISTPPSSRMMQQYERNVALFGEEVAKQIFVNKFELDKRDVVATTFDSKMGASSRRSRP
jgi:MoxR-like ATPase